MKNKKNDDIYSKGEFILKMDGDMWCAHRPSFINIQESNVGFGKTPSDAIKDLIDVESKEDVFEASHPFEDYDDYKVIGDEPPIDDMGWLSTNRYNKNIALDIKHEYHRYLSSYDDIVEKYSIKMQDSIIRVIDCSLTTYVGKFLFLIHDREVNRVSVCIEVADNTGIFKNELVNDVYSITIVTT